MCILADWKQPFQFLWYAYNTSDGLRVIIPTGGIAQIFRSFLCIFHEYSWKQVGERFEPSNLPSWLQQT